MKTTQCCVALSPNHKGALILVRNSSLELLGPGSAIVWTNEKTDQTAEEHSQQQTRPKSQILPTCGNCRKSDSSVISVLVIGDVQLEILDTLAQQKKALWRRVTWLNWLNRLQETSSSIARIECLIQHLNIFFGREVCQSLPSDLLSSLLGCEEIELLWVRDRYFQDWSWDLSPRSSITSWGYLTPERWQTILLEAFHHQSQSGSIPNYCPLTNSLEVSPAKSSPWSETLAKINPFSDQDSPLWDNSLQFKIV
jgi:hypothetical protein